jgi:hypothetical protein
MSKATDVDTDTDTEVMTTDEAVQAALAYEGQRRLWLKALLPLLAACTKESDPSDYAHSGPSDRVQFALDRVAIAVCERIVRIASSDLPAGP